MSTITQLLEDAMIAELSGSVYPVDFDLVWELLGYPNRNNAARCVIAQLIEGVDYITLKSPVTVKKYQPLQKIVLTVEGFVLLALLAKTEQGRNLRRYYVDKKQARTAKLERIYEAS